MGSRDSCSHFELRGRASVELRWSGTVGILLVVRHRVVIPFVVALALVSVWGCGPKVAPLSRGVAPNLLLIVADDLGWGDVGCYGSTFHETPNIDRLAKEGMRFNNAYATCHVCSPSRASILTGKYPARTDLTEWLSGRPERDFEKLHSAQKLMSLPDEEITLAETLKKPWPMTALCLGERP